MAAVPAMDGLAQRVTNRTQCFNSCWLDSNVETARTSTHHLRDAAVRDQDEFMHVLLYVASLIATPEPRSQPSTQSAEEPEVGGAGYSQPFEAQAQPCAEVALRVCSQTGRAGQCFPGCYFEVNEG